MNLKYGIFRSKSIMTINDSARIESHNKQEKKTESISSYGQLLNNTCPLIQKKK